VTNQNKHYGCTQYDFKVYIQSNGNRTDPEDPDVHLQGSDSASNDSEVTLSFVEQHGFVSICNKVQAQIDK
jgi:hypothetical protein